MVEPVSCFREVNPFGKNHLQNAPDLQVGPKNRLLLAASSKGKAEASANENVAAALASSDEMLSSDENSGAEDGNGSPSSSRDDDAEADPEVTEFLSRI
jgi:hypothetical protein